MVNQDTMQPNRPPAASGDFAFIDLSHTAMPAPVKQQAVNNPPRTFIGRLVNKVTQSRTYQSVIAHTHRVTRPIKEWAIDCAGALKILGLEAWRGASKGALTGLAAGCYATYLCPPLMGPAFTVSITAGVTAGGIYGSLSGSMKASEFYGQARQARRAAAAAVRPMQQQQLVVVT